MRIKRGCFSDIEDNSQVKKKDGLVSKIKQGVNYAKTHTFKETAVAAGKGIKNYVKKNPDEAIVLAGSYTVPVYLSKRLKKAGKTGAAAVVLSTAALPLGEGYIAAKKGIKAAIRKRKEDKEN
jgi:hypothetical protein